MRMDIRRILVGNAGRFVVAAVAVSWASPVSASKIACVGDSITYGYNLTNPSKESYPAVLQTLLGAQHTVQNFGSSGCTLLKKGDKPYWNDGQFGSSDAFKPDVVVVMLGTNDAKPQNWSHEVEFTGDYESMIDHYRGLGALVYVAVPPPVFTPGAYQIDPAVLNTEIVPLVRQIAGTANAPVVDVYQALTGKSSLFPDMVHPNAEGARLIAQTVAAALVLHGYGGAAGTGGAPATGGSSGIGGAPGSGGVANAGGSSGTGGAKTSGGVPSSGGVAATGGIANAGGRASTFSSGGTSGSVLGSGGATRSTGGTSQGSGGTRNTGGTPNSGGSAITQAGQASGAGGAETGGTRDLGGTSSGASSGATTSIMAAGGTAFTTVTTRAGTTASSGGRSGFESGAGGSNVLPDTQPDPGGCSCRSHGHERPRVDAWPFALLALVHFARKRAHQRRNGGAAALPRFPCR
jgi:lysophospholipase L1-like esterase